MALRGFEDVFRPKGMQLDCNWRSVSHARTHGVKSLSVSLRDPLTVVCVCARAPRARAPARPSVARPLISDRTPQTRERTSGEHAGESRETLRRPEIEGRKSATKELSEKVSLNCTKEEHEEESRPGIPLWQAWGPALGDNPGTLVDQKHRGRYCTGTCARVRPCVPFVPCVSSRLPPRPQCLFTVRMVSPSLKPLLA